MLSVRPQHNASYHFMLALLEFDACRSYASLI
jgi:hypothetical protein